MAAAGAYFGHLQAAGRSGADDSFVWHGFAALVPVLVGYRACCGTTRSVVMPGISAGGCRSRGNRSGRIGASRIVMVPGSSRRPRAWPIHRRCARIARRRCAAFTTFTWRPAPGRWPIRSRWTGRAGAGGPMPIAARWSPSAASTAACTGLRCRPGYRAASRMRSSTRSSRRWARTGTGRWWRFTCPPARGRRKSPSATRGGVDPGRQLIAVVRKGTRELAELRRWWMRSCGCGSTSWRWRASCPGAAAGSRCGGRCGGRSGR